MGVIMTLALALWPRQGAWKGVGWDYNLGVTFTLLGVPDSVREWAHTLPSELPLWEVKSLWNPKFLKSKFRV
jgi:hypothetical protein